MAGSPLSPTGHHSIAAELHAAAAEHPDLPYLHHDGGTLTFAAAHAAVRQAACGLIKRGLGIGDRVAIWASTDLATAIAQLAVASAGATIVPLNTRYTGYEIAGILGRSRCSMIMAPDHLVGRDLAAEALTVAGDTPVLCLGTRVPDGAIPWEVVCGDTDSAAETEYDLRRTTMTGDEITLIQFTSGTTGEPKGAMLRQGPMLLTGRSWGRIVGLSEGDIYPILYPLSHVGGFKTGLLSPLLARASTILIPVVTSESIIEIFRRHDVTIVNGPPTVLQTLLDAVRDGRLSAATHLRTAVTGSTIVPPQLVKDLATTLGVKDVVNAYGLSEASGVCSMTRRGDDINLVCTTLGRAIDGVEVRIADGEVGDIEVRGPSVMIGYLDDLEATAAVMDDGWLRTGDIGTIDADGYVRITGRVSDMIIVGGFNVYPAEIEHLLLEHETVTEAAVVGAYDARLGEVPVAFVVADKSNGADEASLLAWARERLANFKVPRHVWIVDSLPRGDVGKVSKPALRVQVAELLGTE